MSAKLSSNFGDCLGTFDKRLLGHGQEPHCYSSHPDSASGQVEGASSFSQIHVSASFSMVLIWPAMTSTAGNLC